MAKIMKMKQLLRMNIPAGLLLKNDDGLWLWKYAQDRILRIGRFIEQYHPETIKTRNLLYTYIGRVYKGLNQVSVLPSPFRIPVNPFVALSA